MSGERFKFAEHRHQGSEARFNNILDAKAATVPKNVVEPEPGFFKKHQKPIKIAAGITGGTLLLGAPQLIDTVRADIPPPIIEQNPNFPNPDNARLVPITNATPIPTRLIGPQESTSEIKQDVGTTFDNIKFTSAEELVASQQLIYSVFLEKDSQSNIVAIWTIKAQWPFGDTGKKRFVYRALFNSGTHSFDRFTAMSAELPIVANSIAAKENNVLVGGENPKQSSKTALLSSSDKAQSFTQIPLSVQNGVINEMSILPDTDIVVANIPAFENQGAQDMINITTKQETPIQGTGTRDGLSLATISPDKTKMTMYINAFTNKIGSGYTKKEVEIATGNAISSNTYLENELGYIDGFFAVKDQVGTVTQLLTTNNDTRVFSVVDATTNTLASPQISFGTWLDNRGIPNYVKNSLGLGPVYAIGNRIYSAANYTLGDGSNRLVLLSWQLGENPNINNNTLTVYDLAPTVCSSIGEQKNMFWGKFNGKYGFLINALFNTSQNGVVFVETSSDGSLLPNPSILYLGNGMQDIPQPPATPTNTPTPTSSPSPSPTPYPSPSPSPTIESPTPTPTPNPIKKIFLPLLTRVFGNGW